LPYIIPLIKSCQNSLSCQQCLICVQISDCISVLISDIPFINYNNWSNYSSSYFYINISCQPRQHDWHTFPRKRGWVVCQNFLHLDQNGKDMWLNRTISNTECLHHCLWTGNWSKNFTPDVLPVITFSFLALSNMWNS